jgi:hypothetical protein
MKKISLIIFFTLGLFSTASADKGILLGVSGQMGAFTADASETENGAKSATENAGGVVGYGSIFVEKTIGSKLSIGVDYVPYALESETREDNRDDLSGATARADVVNKVQLDFEDLLTFYVNLNLTENFYVKGGITQVDVITNETLGTGSAYGNTSLDGTVYGVGYHKNFDNGNFFRAEGNVMEFDGAKLTSTTNADNTVTMSKIDGASGKISVGRTF